MALAAATRIKVATETPLPPLKAWHLLDSTTVAQLKQALCKTVLPSYTPENIALSLDGFLLLDPTPTTVLRDGDLVQIQFQANTAPPIVPLAPSSTSKQKQPQLAASSTIDSSESEGSSDTSSDESSSSDSSSEVTSSSDDSTESTSAPSEIPSKAVLKKDPPHHVPPGHGKLATQRRNIRRRKKRQYDRAALQEETNNPNDIPLPRPSVARLQKGQTQPLRSEATSLPIMMASLSNKNKRRGFKQAMSSSLPPKIVFTQDGDEDMAEVPEVQTLPFQTIADTRAFATTSSARLVPPSEKQAAGLLPPNVFVTSIDVEDPERFKTEGKSNYVDPDDTNNRGDPEDVVLSYGDPDESLATKVHFTEIARKWETYSLLNDAGLVKTGSLVAWKALGVNPATWTPEICLHVGRVLQSNPEKVLVVKLQDADVEAHALSGDADVAMEEEEEYSWSLLLQEGWRIVS